MGPRVLNNSYVCISESVLLLGGRRVTADPHEALVANVNDEHVLGQEKHRQCTPNCQLTPHMDSAIIIVSCTLSRDKNITALSTVCPNSSLGTNQFVAQVLVSSQFAHNAQLLVLSEKVVSLYNARYPKKSKCLFATTCVYWIYNYNNNNFIVHR